MSNEEGFARYYRCREGLDKCTTALVVSVILNSALATWALYTYGLFAVPAVTFFGILGFAAWILEVLLREIREGVEG
jgi:nitrate reductase NapE component